LTREFRESIASSGDIIRLMDEETTPAITDLLGRQAAFRLFQHPGPVHSLEQAARERAQQPEQVIRSIVFRLGEGEFLMVLVPGPQQIPWKALRRYLNTSRMTLATEEELLQVTGYTPGTVNPYGLPAPMRVLIDRRILDLAEVSLGSGRRGLAILMTPAAMLQAIEQYELVDLI
jgi:prolyl-tRNA editing enzyme YbaK/EbsC (Cys-tRNA(Pro) deacylase)